MTNFAALVAVLLFAVHFIPTCSSETQISFVDESRKRGLKYLQTPRRKYGGPTVVDLDEDGSPDLLFSHHGGFIELYFNNGNGFFRKHPFSLYRDCHGINAFRLTTFQKGKHFVISRGGNNGNRPGIPDIFHVAPDQSVKNVTVQMNAPLFAGRGRTFIAAHLKPVKTRTDAIFINRGPNNHTVHHYVARGVVGPDGPTFKPQSITGVPFDEIATEFSFVTDINNDHRMEIITYPNLRMYAQNNFRFVDITARVFPSGNGLLSRVICVAELDFDNDGDMDLFVGRATVGGGVGYGKKPPGLGPHDILFENVGGRYVDVSQKANIPRPSQTRGVSAGDVNNDGWVDLVLIRYNEPDVILINNGDGTFTEHDAGFNRSQATFGDHAVAVDFDNDGKLDCVLSEGSWGDRSHGGEYRLMRNVASVGNYLAVRVGSSNFKRCTSLHAVVHVFVDGMIMTRRVGSPGSVVSHSYIENLHFGLGDRTKVESVNVTWSDGSTDSKVDVQANQQINFGVNRL